MRPSLEDPAAISCEKRKLRSTLLLYRSRVDLQQKVDRFGNGGAGFWSATAGFEARIPDFHLKENANFQVTKNFSTFPEFIPRLLQLPR